MKQLKVVLSVAEAAAEYKRLSIEIKALEEAKRAQADFLLESAKDAKGQLIVEHHGMPIKISVVESVRETFDLKTAREHIEPSVLSPYTKISVSEYVRVS